MDKNRIMSLKENSETFRVKYSDVTEDEESTQHTLTHLGFKCIKGLVPLVAMRNK